MVFFFSSDIMSEVSIATVKKFDFDFLWFLILHHSHSPKMCFRKMCVCVCVYDRRRSTDLILQAFRQFTYVTAHFTTFPSLYQRHSSFSNPSVASPMSQLILQPLFRFSYVTCSSLTSPGEPPMVCSTFLYSVALVRNFQQMTKPIESSKSTQTRRRVRIFP